jgi:hypothetical protein
MSRCLPVIIAVTLLAAGASDQEKLRTSAATQIAKEAPAPVDIRGVWRVTQLAWSTPGPDWEIRTPYLSQYIFTDKHFSYMYVPGTTPRKRFAGDPNRPTDAERVEAYNSFIAASGTYTLSGRTLVSHALVHKNPNEMDGKALTYTIEFEGRNVLRMVISNPPFLPGREARTVLTRIE